MEAIRARHFCQVSPDGVAPLVSASRRGWFEGESSPCPFSILIEISLWIDALS